MARQNFSATRLDVVLAQGATLEQGQQTVDAALAAGARSARQLFPECGDAHLERIYAVTVPDRRDVRDRVLQTLRALPFVESAERTPNRWLGLADEGRDLA